MRIGIDVMGGDNAPGAILEGAADAVRHLDAGDRLVLVGDEQVLRRGVEEHGLGDGRVDIVGTTEVIGMDESPVDAVRTKKDSSITVLATLAGRKAKEPLDAIISAGNTGAVVTAAQMHLRRLPKVHRPGIAVAIPTFSGPVVLIDVGANIEPKPQHLTQYGVMGAIYANLFVGVTSPRVGLMNVGAEEAKGTTDMREARDRLRTVDVVNFVGFVEGRGVFNGEADVVVTDGVVGNVMIKLAEGLSAGIFKALGREVAEIDPELAQRLGPVIRQLYAKHDYHEYGGAPLLGVNGAVFICHGSSQARTISKAVLRAKQYVALGINDEIVQRLAATEEVPA
ncbi:MAG: phosphate acyltransferase PlsX [Planctomycetota bacterium]|jgi:glycerol-3-phosphate acyltransferase PlsX